MDGRTNNIQLCEQNVVNRGLDLRGLIILSQPFDFPIDEPSASCFSFLTCHNPLRGLPTLPINLHAPIPPEDERSTEPFPSIDAQSVVRMRPPPDHKAPARDHETLIAPTRFIDSILKERFA